MRATVMLMCGVLVPVTAGCELMVPLAIAGSQREGAPIDDYEAFEPVDLDVRLVEASGRIGDLELDAAQLVPSGYAYGTSTSFAFTSAPALDPREPVEIDPLVIDLELCPIEDIMVYGDDSSALRYLVACNDADCYDASYDLRATVVEDALGRRTVTVDSEQNGSPVHFVLEYDAPS